MAHILIVDDEELVRFTIRKILTTHGHQVSEVVNGAQALKRLNIDKFDLVITDIMMPEMEGIETIQLMRKDYPELPIIAMSGGGRTGNLNYLSVAERFGVRLALSKPFDEKELIDAIDQTLAA